MKLKKAGAAACHWLKAPMTTAVGVVCAAGGGRLLKLQPLGLIDTLRFPLSQRPSGDPKVSGPTPWPAPPCGTAQNLVASMPAAASEPPMPAG